MLQKETLKFLNDLKLNNNKEWFSDNRKRYDKAKADYLGLAGTLLGEMKKHDPSLDILTPKDCIFRINRDIRFSADKSPYKTNLGIVLHPGGKKSNLSAYYLHIEKGQSFVGGGLYMPDAAALAKVRKEIHYFYHDLKSVLQQHDFKNTFGDLSIEDKQKLSRPPKGYEATDPAIEYLKLKSFTAFQTLDDDMLTSDKLVPKVIESFKVIQPLLHFINRGLLSDPNGGL
ncbi:MAG: DUF2461 domain-containing protein [Saprospiraceae bacterium]